MLKRMLKLYAVVGALALPFGIASAADQTRTQDNLQTRERLTTQDSDQIYGSQLMTKQERIQYRSRLRTAKTAQEREQIRMEHHEQMQARARERGLTLPDMPPAVGGGMGPGGGGGMAPGGGMGGGMGPGGGMGGGGRR
jgi:hypothetical protein